MKALICLCIIALLGLARAISSTGSRLLVVQEDESEKSSYSQFWTDLEATGRLTHWKIDRGYDLTFESPKNEQLVLFTFGERSFDHLILAPPKSKGYGPALNPKKLLDFLDHGGNILLALSANSAIPSAISSLLLELDIKLPPDRTALVVDHFNYDHASAAEKHDVLLTQRSRAIRPNVKDYFGGDGILAVPRAVGQSLGNASPLLASILTAPETAYSYNPKEDEASLEDPFATGTQISLVTALQARNSARFTVLGSFEMLADKWFTTKVKGAGNSQKPSNRDFAKQLSAWTFQESGVLKVGEIQHYEMSRIPAESSSGINGTQTGPLNPAIYRIKNQLAFSIEISEYKSDHLAPFILPPDDALQLEFTMLSPYQRLSLQPISQTNNSTTFGTSFTVPDQHGIFAFNVNYKRPFMTPVEEKVMVTVRHFAHDEYPRSWTITGGWPWIAGLWSVIAAFLVFVVLWLYSEPAKAEKS